MDDKVKYKRPILQHLWQQNVRKSCRNSGQQYTTKSGKIIPARQLRGSCSNKICRLKCSNNISDEIRKDLFKQYWNMADYQRQRDFLSNCILYNNHKVEYSLEILNHRLIVCRKFFVNTFDISTDVIREICKKKSAGINGTSLAIKPDQRGKVNHYRTPIKLMDHLRNYLKSLPTIVKRSKQIYLDLPVYSIPQLYKRYQTDLSNSRIVSEGIFRRIFNCEFNLRFQKRLKINMKSERIFDR